VAELIRLENEILSRQAKLLQVRIGATKIRVHGDYHLGQVLNTGKDVVITEFEGEPARPMSERKMKRPAMQDIADILRSFHYAIYSAPSQQQALSEDDTEFLKIWAERWAEWMKQLFMDVYLETVGRATFIPADPAAFYICSMLIF